MKKAKSNKNEVKYFFMIKLKNKNIKYYITIFLVIVSFTSCNVLDESNVRWDLDKRAIIVMAGLAKLFAGDIVESARRIMENRREKGGVCPRHLREAYRQLERMGRLPRPGRHKKLRR